MYGMATYRDAVTLGKPLPPHAQTKAARSALKSQRRDAQRRRDEARATVTAGVTSTTEARPPARRLELVELTGSPARVARTLTGHGADVAATIAANGSALSVWAIMADGRRVRALYRRTATGWGSDGVIVDGQLYGVTAALSALGE